MDKPYHTQMTVKGIQSSLHFHLCEISWFFDFAKIKLSQLFLFKDVRSTKGRKFLAHLTKKPSFNFKV